MSKKKILEDRLKKSKACKRCGAPIYPNQVNCSDCVDIILFGSKEKAAEAAKESFRKLGLT